MSTIRIPAQRPAPDQVAAPAAPAPVAAEPGWGRVLRTAVARASLVLVGCLAVWSLLPLLVGWTPHVILSGSMEPRVHVGDIIVTREVPAATLTKGQVITVTDPDHPSKTRTHRLLRVNADGTLTLKGDANHEADSSPVSVDDVLGLGVIRVPFVGRPTYWMAEGNLLPVAATTLFLGWCVMNAFPGKRRSDEDETPDAPTGDAGRPTDQPRERSARPRRVAVTIAAAVVAVGAVSGPADAAFKLAVGNPVSTLSAAASFYSYKSAVLGDSPYLYWRLNESSGTAIDDAGTGSKDGTLLAQTYSFGQAGAITTEPANKAMSVSVASITANASATGPNKFSVEAWIKTASTSGGRILGFGNGTGQNASSTVDRQLYLAPTGKAYFGIGSAKTTIASTRTVNDNAWHHVVGTYTTGNNGMKLYVDGVLQGQTTATTTLTTGYWRAAAEGMSGWAGNPGQFFVGTLDELAVYTDVLTPAEIQTHYAAATS